MRIIQAGLCDTGLKRKVNQDSVLMMSDSERKANLYVVADGMGGHTDGEVASGMITDGLKLWWQEFNPDDYENDFRKMLISIQNKIAEINKNIYEKYNNGVVCGSTCILLFIFDGQYGIISAGDSRIYMKRGLRIDSVMIDDVWENQRYVQENLTDKQRRTHSNYGKLINAIGTSDEVKLSVKTDVLMKNDTFLLCSDGLYKYCPEKYINRVLRKINEDSIQDCIETLVQKTYKNEAKDNISIILVKNINN